MDHVELTALYGSAIIDTTGYSKFHEVSLLAQTVADMQAISDEWRGAYQQALSSTLTTNEGKAMWLGEVGPQYVNRFARFDKLIEIVRTKLAAMQAAMNADPSESNDAARVLREREVRDWLRGVDPLERVPLWLKAIAEGDTLTFDAFRNAPRVMNLLPSEMLEQGVAQWGQKRDPQKAKLMADLTAALATVVRYRDTAVAKIRQDANLPGNDAFSVIAKG